ncbi:MAG TPA: helix-turn-helix transcriptional regulator [Ktedonobacteraceae bacterium]|jgi:transcriptional regulator with XRE-family HTH domain
MAEDTRGVPVPQLLKLRKHVGLSQEELAARAGLARSTITKLEHGANARYATIDKLAEALQTTREGLIHPKRGRKSSSLRKAPLR